MNKREEERTKKEMIKAFVRAGVPPRVILNDSDECKELAIEEGDTPEERKEIYWGCMADKLEGETRRSKKKKYFKP